MVLIGFALLRCHTKKVFFNRDRWFSVGRWLVILGISPERGGVDSGDDLSFVLPGRF